jgi:hypothetical protein
MNAYVNQLNIAFHLRNETRNRCSNRDYVNLKPAMRRHSSQLAVLDLQTDLHYSDLDPVVPIIREIPKLQTAINY